MTDLEEKVERAGEAEPRTSVEEPEIDGDVSRTIAREMVRLYKEYVGRGPTYARAYVHDDVVMVVLRDTMIQAERTLAEEGEPELVRALRRVFQGKFRDEAMQLVADRTGRRVKTFLSDHEIESDTAVEVFMLD
ncbi:DUF2294 domain-containing protein [Thermoleophilia bacterium SCSIO 60948]|nr:DUF2294 domain-containing protein [Thermoleophilia bacterium SCSIO 60948]